MDVEEANGTRIEECRGHRYSRIECDELDVLEYRLIGRKTMAADLAGYDFSNGV